MNYSCASSAIIILIVLNLLFGAWTLNYDLAMICGRTIPLLPAIIAGSVLGEFTIPLAVIFKVMEPVHLAHFPLIH